MIAPAMRPESPVGARKDDGYFIFVSLDSYVGANNSKNILVYDITITFMGVINPLITRGPHCIMCVCVLWYFVFCSRERCLAGYEFLL